ncbi:MAG: energy transducer TonB [Armatimonadota bacterium]|nr:energy transducer TonB [Armatimonadota bacterium]
MSNKVLTYAIAISVMAHILALGIIGGTSASKPIEVETLKLVKVDLVKTPDDVPDGVEPPKAREAEPPPQYVPTVKQMKEAPPPSPKTVEKIVREMKRVPGPYKVASASTSGRPAGNPGGALNLGSTSDNGQNLGGAGGTSSPGYVANNNGGSGTGSGAGAGVGTQDPPKNADDGPGTKPEVAPPPPPRTVEVTVCSVSGLRLGRYCEKTSSRTFREDDAPSATCNVCKEPEPRHVNRLADRSEPELTSDSKVRVPESIMEEGIDATVKIEYTVDGDGVVSGVKVTDSSGNRELDRAVVDAAKRMKYKPAVQAGVPRAVKKTRTYRIKV